MVNDNKVNMDIPSQKRSDGLKREINPARTNEIERHKQEQRNREQPQQENRKEK